MKKQLKRITMILLIMVIYVVIMNGCEKKQQEIRGGEILRYSICIKEGKSQIVSCPIIVEEKAESIKLKKYDSDKKEELSVTMQSIDMNECVEYKEHYVYFAILDISCKTNDRAVNADISSLTFEVDGQELNYKTPYFNVKNTKYYCEENNCMEEENVMYIGGDFTGIYGYIPTEDKRFDLAVTGKKDLKLKSYKLADYMEISKFDIDGKEADSNCINMEMKNEEEKVMEYTVNFAENVGQDNIIRASQILIYEHDGKDYLWVYTSGVYLWKDYTDYGNIKRYIDSL